MNFPGGFSCRMIIVAFPTTIIVPDKFLLIWTGMASLNRELASHSEEVYPAYFAPVREVSGSRELTEEL